MRWLFGNIDFFVRLFVILISLLQPFILIYFCGELTSLSQYWETPLQPLFIFINATTSYFFFDLKDWKIPSLFLMLLTAFSVTLYPAVHNLFAVLFFISCLYSLYTTKRFRIYTIIYCISLIIGLLFGLLWLEIFAILVLTVYHLHILVYKEFLLNQRK
jgi:hypothetical protein